MQKAAAASSTWRGSVQDVLLELAVLQPSRFYEAAGLLCLCSWKQGGEEKERNLAFHDPGKQDKQHGS